MKLTLPDNTTFEGTKEQCQAYAAGFTAALRCFGIYKDGVQRIGCMENPIKGYIEDINRQLKEGK